MNETRPGTKTRILDAAEELIATNGFAATSLRTVTAAASVNLAAVNYHFGSKDELLRAAFHRLADPVNHERLELLDGLEQQAEAPRLEAILEAFLRPALNVVVSLGPRGRVVTRFLGRVVSDPSPAVQNLILAEFGAVSERFVRALGRALPDLSQDELWWRFKLMVGVLVFVQTDESWKRELPPNPEPPDLEPVTERTVGFLAQGLQADATTKAQAG